ncbi:MAG: hypothetical protein ACKV0T_18800 [Planctomycetales bacterium]
MRWGGLIALWMVCLTALVGTRGALAAGNETTRGAHDLRLTVDSRWTGGVHGGYYPIRIRVTNLIQPRELEFRFVGVAADDGSNLPTVVRRTIVDQGATQELTLSIPMASTATQGELRLFENGRRLEQLTQTVTLPEVSFASTDRPSLLVIHPSAGSIDCTKYEEAVRSLTGGASSNNNSFYIGGRLVSGVRSNEYQVVSPTMLPESWVDYSAVDVIAVPLSTLTRLSAPVSEALVRWTEAGGTLLVTEVGGPAEQSQELARVLQLDRRAASPPVWKPADPALQHPVSIVQDPNGTGNFVVSTQGTAAQAQGAVNPAEALGLANKTLWGAVPTAFSQTPLMAGRVFAFPENPFPGAPIDWAWWMSSAQWSSRVNWTARHGISSRQRHPDYFSFLIPGVGAVPVMSFVFLITVFSILIGPVNYFVVWRRRQLYLLVVTIPAIAFLTSCTLFGYAMIADGFSVQSRLRTMTLLDQRAERAVSFSRISMYAGMAPSSGLRFSPETAVFPIWSEDTALESGTTEWGTTQHLASGWLRSRTPAQFETVACRNETRGVRFKTNAAGDIMEAVNDFPWEIEALVVRGAEPQKFFAAQHLKPGEATPLHPATDDDRKLLAEPLATYKLEAPAGIESNTLDDPFNQRSRRAMSRGWYGGMNLGPSLTFSQSVLEQGLYRLTRPTNEPDSMGLAPRSYLATFSENPGIELGVDSTIPKAGVHALLGFY